MRLWSLHPSQLDTKGLVAVWREGLLARAVLLGKTKGYRHHPQLDRFRRRRSPVSAIDVYLHHILHEAELRGYRFDGTKLGKRVTLRAAPVSRGQLEHEWAHLLAKLRVRDRARWSRQREAAPKCHPSFRVVRGGIEVWERSR